jgi:membrane-associated phospholipid phosphatase
MVLAPCALLLFRAGRPGAAAAVAGATAAWAGLVAYGRVLSGAHFPTDVLASVGLGLALAPLSLALGDRLVARLSPTAS